VRKIKKIDTVQLVSVCYCFRLFAMHS